jgi:hypothetical protein
MTVHARGGEALVDHADSLPALLKRMSLHFTALRKG